MARSWKVAVAVVALVLGAARAHAQECGKDFYGPCLPDSMKGKPAVDPMTRTAFDEAAFGGGDDLITGIIFSDASGSGTASVKASIRTTFSDAPASPRRVESPRAGGLSSEEGTPPIDPGVTNPGRTMAPVHTQPRSDPEAGTMVKVVAPMSATGRLDWISVETQKAPRYALNEETYNQQSGLWEAAPRRNVRTDLEEDSRKRNYIRPTSEE